MRNFIDHAKQAFTRESATGMPETALDDLRVPDRLTEDIGACFRPNSGNVLSLNKE